MWFLVSGFAWLFTKVFSPLGLSFLNPVLQFVNSKREHETRRQGMFWEAMSVAIDGEVQARRVASEERIALWDSFWYKLLIYAIVGPPALYVGAVFVDSVFDFSWVVLSPRDIFDQLAVTILCTFIGAGGFVGGVVGAMKFLRKGR